MREDDPSDDAYCKKFLPMGNPLCSLYKPWEEHTLPYFERSKTMKDFEKGWILGLAAGVAFMCMIGYLILR